MLASGRHGDNFKYMSVIQGSKSEHFPRIVQIAGLYPGLTPEELMAPSSSPAAEPGFWTYSFPDPEDPNVGVIAVPGSDVVSDCLDPVAVIAKSPSLGFKGDEVEMVVIIDRADTDFVSGEFYAFQTFENQVEILWADRVDGFSAVLGKVVLCMAPADRNAPLPSGFLEDDD